MFPIYNYPTKAETDPNILYQGLGSFWTQIFQDKGMLKGYTTGLAEEIIQRYYDLLEVINSYSVDDIPVFHREKWQPILVYKSKLGEAPFTFKPSDVIFGPQSSSDTYFKNTTFQFGFPKRPSAEVYVYDVGASFKDFGVIADKIFAPSVFYINGADVVLTDGVLYFNTNPFDNPDITKIDIISENGERQTYLDSGGNTQNEQLIVLWAYHASLDQDLLYKHFGYIFNLHMENTEFFKKILQAIFELYINGPTVANIKSICAAFLGVPVVIAPREEVVDIFNDGKFKFVITDKNAYRFDLLTNILPQIRKGVEVFAGDILVDAIEYYDNVSTPGWWKNSSVIKSKFALSSHLFLGSYTGQLVLSNGIELVTVAANGDIVFPIEGKPVDVDTFNTQLNVNKAELKPLLGVSNPGDAVPIQPVDFIMSNFLKANTVFLKFSFGATAIQSKFLALLPILYKQLPPYVYVVFGLTLNMVQEVYDRLNDAIVIQFDVGDITLNADGSDSAGFIESLAPHYYKNAKKRLFELSLGVAGLDNQIVGAPQALEQDEYASAVSAGRTLEVRVGKLLKSPLPHGSTANFNKLQFLDFVN